MRVLTKICILLALTLVSSGVNAQESPKTKNAFLAKVEVTYSDANGIGAEEGVMRRDPSDVIKVGDLFFVWYTKGAESGGYNGTVWYATSPDGHNGTEKGEAVSRGEKGSWDGQSVFTPNILIAKGRYWLFYTGVSFYPKKGKGPDSKIGIAVADSPNGPWEKLATNPVHTNSENKDQFDSHFVDDACLIVRGGKCWLYYKGRQLGKSPKHTQMGLAIADQPEGPYVKVENNPVIPGNHEVLVWPQGTGVAAMIGTTGPKAITRSLMYSEDGLTFTKTHDVTDSPHAPGAYRAEAFTDSGKGERIEWGVEIGQKGKKSLPFIQRFELGANESAKITEGEKRVNDSSVSSRPQFSWDHVPLYMHVRKSKAFTPRELNYLAEFPLITLEKTTGSKTHGSSEAGARAAAKAIKAVNPDSRILDYRNVTCNYSSYDVNSKLQDIPGAFLFCAEKYSYFLPHDGYSVNGKDSSVWLKRFPEFDKPLGPPKGPAVQDGYTYTREFESARVFLDIEKKEAKITWK